MLGSSSTTSRADIVEGPTPSATSPTRPPGVRISCRSVPSQKLGSGSAIDLVTCCLPLQEIKQRFESGYKYFVEFAGKANTHHSRAAVASEGEQHRRYTQGSAFGGCFRLGRHRA
jgi:hypothetical protein